MRIHRQNLRRRLSRLRPRSYRRRSGQPSGVSGSSLTQLAYHIDAYLSGQEKLDRLRDKHRRWNDDEREVYERSIDAVMRFNALLRRVIVERHNSMSFDELESYLLERYEAMHGQRDIEDVRVKFRAALVGIRHEVSFARVLDHTRIPYRHGSDHEDTRGGDYMLYGYIPIDIKSSQANADRERRVAIQHHHDPSHIFYSGITPEDYEGRLLLPEHHAERIARDILPTLEDIVARFHRKNPSEYTRR